jgi:hypothetical protein
MWQFGSSGKKENIKIHFKRKIKNVTKQSTQKTQIFYSDVLPLPPCHRRCNLHSCKHHSCNTIHSCNNHPCNHQSCTTVTPATFIRQPSSCNLHSCNHHSCNNHSCNHQSYRTITPATITPATLIILLSSMRPSFLQQSLLHNHHSCNSHPIIFIQQPSFKQPSLLQPSLLQPSVLHNHYYFNHHPTTFILQPSLLQQSLVQPSLLQPSSYSLHPATFILQPLSCNLHSCKG